jgi:catalase
MFVYQVMSVDESKSRAEAFDVTKTWSEIEFPLLEIGKFTLDKIPSNFFAEVEQAAFSPANFVPGEQILYYTSVHLLLYQLRSIYTLTEVYA